jgi:hypothetical protein
VVGTSAIQQAKERVSQGVVVEVETRMIVLSLDPIGDLNTLITSYLYSVDTRYNFHLLVVVMLPALSNHTSLHGRQRGVRFLKPATHVVRSTFPNIL